MNTLEFNSQLRELFTESREVVITTHSSPDGDAMGSSLGLYEVLKNLGHNVSVIVPDEYPEFLQWMPSTEEVFLFDRDVEISMKLIHNAEIIFSLDYNHLSRIGRLFQEEIIKNEKATLVMIDHHQQPDNYAHLMYSDTSASSTCEMVYNAVRDVFGIDHINDKSATCLYTGIMTDTGSFRFPSTSPNTHRAIADLMERGANGSAIHESILDTNTIHRLRLLGYTLLEKMDMIEDGTVAVIHLTEEELKSHNFRKGDTEGFVNYALSMKGVQVAAFFRVTNGLGKISFRSKGDVAVNELAKAYFQGGGHKNAAGGKFDNNINDAIELFKEVIGKYI